MRKNASIYCMHFLGATLFCHLLSSNPAISQGACTGSETSAAGNLENAARSCADQIKESNPSAYGAASSIAVDASSIKGQLGNLCPQSETGNELFDRAKNEIVGIKERLSSQGAALNRDLANAAIQAKGHALAAKTPLSNAANYMHTINSNQSNITSSLPEASGVCPGLDQAATSLQRDLESLDTKVQEDKNLASRLEQEAQMLANASNAVTGQPEQESASSLPPSSTEPESFADNSAPATNPSSQANAAPTETSQDNSREDQTAGAPPPSASQPQQASKNSESDKDKSDSLAELGSDTLKNSNAANLTDNLNTEDILAAYERYRGEQMPKATSSGDPSKQPASETIAATAPSQESLGFQTKAQRALSELADKKAHYTQTQNVKATDLAEEATTKASKSSASFLDDGGDATRALASPSGFENLSVEDALKKINQIPIKK